MNNTKENISQKSLSNLSNEELFELYKESFELTPLRLLYTKNQDNLALLTEDMLVALLQNGYEDAKKTLFNLVIENNYQCSDESLVLLAQENDQVAREMIAVKYIDFVKRTVKRKGRYNRGDQEEDLIQSGYIGFYKAIRDFKIDRKRPFKIFVQHVINRHIESIISRAGSNKMKTLNEAYSYHSPVSKNDSENTFEHLLKSEDFRPEHHLITNETFWEVWNTFSETEKYVCWYYAEDYSYEEIGEIVFRTTHPTVEAQIKAVDNTMQRIKSKREDFIKQLKKSK